jgi:hypothetical protein
MYFFIVLWSSFAMQAMPEKKIALTTIQRQAYAIIRKLDDKHPLKVAITESKIRAEDVYNRYENARIPLKYRLESRLNMVCNFVVSSTKNGVDFSTQAQMFNQAWQAEDQLFLNESEQIFQNQQRLSALLVTEITQKDRQGAEDLLFFARKSQIKPVFGGKVSKASPRQVKHSCSKKASADSRIDVITQKPS